MSSLYRFLSAIMRLKPIIAIAGCLVLTTTAGVTRGQVGPAVSQLSPAEAAAKFNQELQNLAGDAAAGRFVSGDPPSVTDLNPPGGDAMALSQFAQQAGISNADVQAALDKINAISQQALQNGLNNDTYKQATEGGTFSYLWDMGVIYPGFPYESPFPVHNGCRVEQEATIIYPNPMPLKPVRDPTDRDVWVPPYSTRIAQMVLQYPQDPPGAYPNAFCEIKVGNLSSIHHGFTVNGPNFTYTCQSAKREYTIVLYLCHGSGGDGGGGGKPKPGPKKGGVPTLDLLSASPCQHFWNTGKFTSSPNVKTPESCVDYFRQMAHELFDRILLANRAANPLQWAWVPTGAAIDRLSIRQIMTLRQQIVADLLKSGA